MLSYQHAFHAGNHADILKHYVVTFVLNSLNKKDKPYTIFDTHSGSGLYDLLDNRSLKTGEAKNGITAFLDYCKKQNNLELGESFSRYYDLVSSYTDKNLYPGSPLIEKSFMREQDKLILSELHPQEVENLKYNLENPKDKKSVQIHHRNGFEMLKALTPPPTKRGVVLIDPSYEETKDYLDVSKTICQVHKKWTNGIILLWYPLLAHRETEIQNMIDSITDCIKLINENTEILNLTLCVADKNSHKEVELSEVLSDVDKKNPPRLYGSGMFVINAPWHLKEEAQNFIEFATSFFA